MSKVTEIKQKAINYGFEAEFVNSINVGFTNAPDYGYDGKLGKYQPLTNTVELYDTDIEAIFPTYLHELTHVLQHHEFMKRCGTRLGTIMYWLALTFLRPKVEKDAREIEDRIYAHVEHMTAQPVE